MALQIIKGKTGIFDPSGAYVDQGWQIAGGYATHYPCYPGVLNYTPGFVIEVGKQYTVEYTVDRYVSGSVKVQLGGNDGITTVANGRVVQTLFCTSDPTVSFYSDGFLRLSNFKIYDVSVGEQPGKTIVFFDGDKGKKWGLEYSFVTEYMIRFKNALYAFKDGDIWLNNSNETRNNFFGVQYDSEVRIIANVNPSTKKLFYSMRVESNRCWFAPNMGDISIPATEGKSGGMQSRLKKNRFIRLQGSYFADFLRNMLTPGIDTPGNALYKGAELRGQYMEIRLINKDTIEVILFEIDVKSETSMYSY